MYRIRTLDKISTVGLELLSRDKYEVASEIPNPDAILVRSTDMHNLQLPDTLKVIARAGIGINNIPVETCTERGIVVLNTPGANANSVKELVLASLILASRDIIGGTTWAKSLLGRGDEIPAFIERGKSKFAGPEIQGKNLGVIGLGTIGVMVANDAVALGMNVTGYDPFISVESAWGLSRNVKRAMGIEALISESEYITIHVPLTEHTKGMLNGNRFALMKKGVRLLNFARGGLINNEDLIKAIENGIVAIYITDFPDEDLLKQERVIAFPHIGASTPEAENNCAIMATKQVSAFLEYGNIINSINFPNCEMPPSQNDRIIIANRNIPNMVGQITTILAGEMINIAEMLNKHKDGLAYNIIDVDENVPPQTIRKLQEIEGVIMVRVLKT